MDAKRRLVTAWLSAALLALSSAGAVQADSRPMKLEVPYSAGGMPDMVARLVAKGLSDAWENQPVIVENKPGAGGAVAASTVLQAGPNGNTFLLTDGPGFVIAPFLNRANTYVADRDFTPVSLIGTAPLFLAVNANVPVHSLDELIALAKAEPGKLNYGSSGIGSIHHLSAEAMKAELGISITHIPYRGSANAVPAMIAGQVDMVFAGLPVLKGFVESGKARLIAVNSLHRSPLAPDVPALAEKIPGFDFAFTVVLLAPTGTASAAVERLSAAVAKVVRMPTFVQKVEAVGLDVAGSTPAQATSAMKAESKRILKAAEIANLKTN